jgi:hypothetical protein
MRNASCFCRCCLIVNSWKYYSLKLLLFSVSLLFSSFLSSLFSLLFSSSLLFVSLLFSILFSVLLFSLRTSLGDGDGTIPLLSLSYLCLEGWKDPLFNPHGVKVVTSEYADNSLPFLVNPRGGDGAGDHVDMLGNREFLEEVILLATGNAHLVREHIHSESPRISKNIHERVKALP